MIKASSSTPDDLRPTTTPTHPLTQTAPPPGPSWLAGTSYPPPGIPAYREGQHITNLMGNKHGSSTATSENVRGQHHLPPSSSATSSTELELTERTRALKEEGAVPIGGGGGGSASTASSGIGSESPEKNSPGVVRGGSDTAEWLAQIGTGQLHHGRTVVTVGVTLPSDIITIAPSTVPTTDSKHYYSPKDVVYASTPVNPVSLSSLQYSTPSTVHLTTVPSYSPYLSPYGLPYIGYPAQSALTPGIESYSAMLASMGNQVQQAQAHLPSSPFITPGLAIPSPYTPIGIPAGLTPAAKGSPLPDNASSAVAYIGGHVIPTPSLLPTSHSLQTSVLPAAAVANLGGGSHIPGTAIKTEDIRQDLSSQSKHLEQQRHEQELQRYMETSAKHAGIREARVSPFERRNSSPLGKEQIRTGRDSGIPESPRQSMDLSPSGKVDPSRQQYYREIGIGTVKMEPGGHGQSYLTASQSDAHLYKDHSRSTEGARTHNLMNKTSVINRTPPIVSPIPSTVHMTSRITSGGQSQQSLQSGLMLSPAPQVRSTPSITTRNHPTVAPSHHQGTAIQPEYAATQGVTAKIESHRFVSDTQEQRQHGTGESSRQSTLTNVPSYFTRGSIIQLANGELRRVEDLRTEDFVQSAELTEGLKIDSSTVLKVEEDHRRGVAHIGFLVGEQKAQVSSHQTSKRL